MANANTLAWLSTLERIKALRVERIVPSEGPSAAKRRSTR